ncbi:MAG TPA: DUF2007 domain-containing protein [Oligoflexus sp.]|uniref:putative signal transducing protein n=1 Tax=Oligoflexus sp. TaxID=1971216 RepID=UPI002D570EDF|nr:DUF2007 domain-containing protein [Oligoflexus sp.]HYX39281.1 DUF2007 domain-containing protein [Oligoflexus sp.]
MNANIKKWVLLTSFSDRLQADLAACAIRGSGIRVELKSDDAGGLYPPLTVAYGVELYVPEEQLDHAKELLQGISDA